jgi:hypothetical protein
MTSHIREMMATMRLSMHQFGLVLHGGLCAFDESLRHALPSVAEKSTVSGLKISPQGATQANSEVTL